MTAGLPPDAAGGGGQAGGGAAGDAARNRAIAAGVAVLAVAAFAETFTFQAVPSSLLGGLGAVEFPRAVILLLLALAAALALGQEETPAPPPAEPRGWLVMASCGGYLVLLHLIGLLAAMAIFLVAAGWLWGERRWLLLLVSSGGLTASVWLVFERILHLALPGGIWLG